MSVSFNDNINKFTYTVNGREKIVSRKVATDLIIELAKTGNKEAQAIAQQIGRGPLAARRLRKGLEDGTIKSENVANLISGHLEDFKARIGSKDEMKLNKGHLQAEAKLQKSYDQSINFLDDLERYAESISENEWPDSLDQMAENADLDQWTEQINTGNMFGVLSDIGNEALEKTGKFKSREKCLDHIDELRGEIQSKYEDAIANPNSKAVKNFKKSIDSNISALKSRLPEEVLSNFQAVMGDTADLPNSAAVLPSAQEPEKTAETAKLTTLEPNQAQKLKLLEKARENKSKLNEFGWEYFTRYRDIPELGQWDEGQLSLREFHLLLEPLYNDKADEKDRIESFSYEEVEKLLSKQNELIERYEQWKATRGEAPGNPEPTEKPIDVSDGPTEVPTGAPGTESNLSVEGKRENPASADTAVLPENQPPVSTAEGNPPAKAISTVPSSAPEKEPEVPPEPIKTATPESKKTETTTSKPPVKPNPEKQQAAPGGTSIKDKIALFDKKAPPPPENKPGTAPAASVRLAEQQAQRSQLEQKAQKNSRQLTGFSWDDSGADSKLQQWEEEVNSLTNFDDDASDFESLSDEQLKEEVAKQNELIERYKKLTATRDEPPVKQKLAGSSMQEKIAFYNNEKLPISQPPKQNMAQKLNNTLNKS